MRIRLAATVLWAGLGVLSSVRADDHDVVIHEISYHPWTESRADEFLEIYNRGGTTVDLSEWILSEGVTYLFPAGLSIAPKSYLVISPDAAATRARLGAGVQVVGNYSGSLDNDGELVALRNQRGEIISRVHYGDGRAWPSAADGSGPTLELIDPFAQIDWPRNWRESVEIGGTPGRVNSRTIGGPESESSSRVLVEIGDEWRYRKGTSAYPASWRQLAFDDAGWDLGPTGIGYGDGDDETVLDDMEDGYVSFAARRVFSISAADLDEADEALLSIDYDDSYVAWLNGVEIARSNVGVAGDVPDFDVEADGSREAGSFEAVSFAKSVLQVGSNVLAIQLHNAGIGSSDASLLPRLALLSGGSGGRGTSQRSSVVVNELAEDGPGGAGFVELHNRSGAAVDVGGWAVRTSAGNVHVLPPGTMIAAGAWHVIDAATLGFATPLAGARYALETADGAWADTLNPRPGRAGANSPYGRFPDGDDDAFVLASRSGGGANVVSLSRDVVINEIFYHPGFVAPGGGCTVDCSDREQWIELHNRGVAPVTLDGWSLTKGVNFSFPTGVTIAAGGFLVVSSSRDTFLARHPGADPALVLGDWSRDLSHDADTVNLRDDVGNLVDHVAYGDGGPLNDEEPEDDIDDGTFLGSEWPREADRDGRTLELRHPALENRLGGSWRASVSSGGTPLAANSVLDASAAPVIGAVTHDPPVPSSSTVVRIRCRVSSQAPLSSVEALWRVEGGGPSGAAALVDDGSGADDRANDGVYHGLVPPQANNATVSFRIVATSADGATTVPARPPVDPYAGFAGPRFLYQVLDRLPPQNPSPSFWIVMTDADAEELATRPLESNVLLPATFIGENARGEIDVRHLAGVRYRGSATRGATPRSYRVALPAERDFDGVERLNFNSQSIQNEILASDLFVRAGMPAPLVATANLTFRGTTNTRYVRKERVDRAFVERYWGGASDDGNLYRGYDESGAPAEADLSYLGEDPAAYAVPYAKRTHREEADWSDVIELTRAFDRTETSDVEFPDLIESLIDTWQWARFFAVQALLTNEDGGIHSSSGEDYFLYRVPEGSPRADAGKFLLVPWDLEESYASRTERLFRPSIDAIQRFLTHPRFAPLYYCNLMELRDGVFSRSQIRQRFRLIDFLYDFGVIDGIDAFITARIGFIDQNVPRGLTVGSLNEDPAGGGLVAVGDIWRFFRGTREPSGGTIAWTQRAFVDSSWESGPTGIGYGDGDDATELVDMEGSYSTVYARRRFVVESPAALSGLELSIDYDDGFVAFINGIEVARRNGGAAGSAVAFDDFATGGREAGAAESIDISAAISSLVAGENVLAVVGLNATIDSSDFSLAPALRTRAASDGTIGCGDLVYTSESTVTLAGLADACATARVELNGVAASFDSFTARWSGTVSVSPGDTVVPVESFDGFGILLERVEMTVRRIAGAGSVVSGSLAADVTWTQAGSPYLLAANLTVPVGRTLRIEPGVVVYGGPDASILVEGEIQALGTEAAPIRFRAASCDERWGGVGIRDTGIGAGSPTHTFRWCDFELGDTPGGFSGHVSPVGSRLLVDHCSFRFLTANAVDGTDARVEVRDSSFRKIEEGVHCTRSVVVVLDCFFQGMTGDKDAIDFDFNGSERSRIERCIFLDGSDDGIDLGDTTVDIRDNVFFNIQDKALSLEGNGPLGPPVVTGNLIVDCGTGIALKSGVTVNEAHHNTVVGNQEGINLFAKAGASDGGHGVFHSTIVWNNSIDVKLDALSTVSFTYSDLPDRVWPGVGNISLDPHFVDALRGDFSLRAGSPCIGTGRDGSDMGAIPFESQDTGEFIRGDVDESGALSLTDAIRTLEHLFQGGAAPECRDRMDANDDGSVNIADPVYALLFLFSGGAAPPAPYPTAGVDPTPDGVPCP